MHSYSSTQKQNTHTAAHKPQRERYTQTGYTNRGIKRQTIPSKNIDPGNGKRREEN
jgi:hypothetical protein